MPIKRWDAVQELCFWTLHYDGNSTVIILSLFALQCCQYLHENISHLRPIEQSFRVFYESLKEDSLTTLVGSSRCRVLYP